MKKYFIVFYLIILTFLTSCDNKPIEFVKNNLELEKNDNLELKNGIDNIEKNNLNFKNIINNGSMVVQYGDLIYFYASNDNNNSELDWSIYSMKEGGTQKNKIFETDYKDKLYFIDNYIIKEDYNDSILKISVETGES